MDELTTSQKDGSGIDRYGENLTGIDSEEEFEATTSVGGLDEEGRSDPDIAMGGEVDDDDDDAMMLFVFPFPLL